MWRSAKIACRHVRRVKDDKHIVSCTKTLHGPSRFKGVNGVPRGKGMGWYARIKIDKHCKHLGIFDVEEDAAVAYDEAAVLHHGEFAMTNRKLGLLA
jgi:hypothetical protein